MRIIAGAAKGRRLVGPRGSQTRPMTDRVKEALFSSLGDSVVGADVLDLFAGSGSLGLEALSRGARSATFVEHSRAALSALERNVSAVALGGTVRSQAVESFLGSPPSDIPIDGYRLVFVDPPYAAELASVVAVITLLSPIVAERGIVVLHRRVGDEAPSPDGWERTGPRRYGDSALWRYERTGRDGRHET